MKFSAQKKETFIGERKVSSFILPLSDLLSEPEKEYFKQIEMQEVSVEAQKIIADISSASIEKIPGLRQRYAEIYYQQPSYQAMIRQYPDVNITMDHIDGVAVECFESERLIQGKSNQCILINLHGGGFIHGSRTNSRIESIPIAAVSNRKVISVDYRMAPEHCFPAATDDVVKVYEALLSQYQPEQIGIYGCSAGGLLTAQTIARLQSRKIPLPAAVAMSCGAGLGFYRGDSSHIVPALFGNVQSVDHRKNIPYLGKYSLNDSTLFPGNSDEIMADFPPALLLSSTRDFAMSAVIENHRQLTRLGVETQLHLWDGLNHAFLYDVNLPQSREAYDVLVRFFDNHLV